MAAEIIKQVLELLFPFSCAICGAGDRRVADTAICETCFERIEYVRQVNCNTCGMVVEGSDVHGHRCGNCQTNPPPYEIARSLVFYSDPLTQLIARLKYHEDTTVLSIFGKLAESADLNLFYPCDVIVPVPLHPIRLRQRGLNQSFELAKCFFPEQREKIMPNTLVKVRNTSTQTGLGGKERRNNLRGAFAVSRELDVENKTVCVVDDVFTTGTTISECSKVLLASGATKVRAVTLARVRS